MFRSEMVSLSTPDGGYQTIRWAIREILPIWSTIFRNHIGIEGKAPPATCTVCSGPKPDPLLIGPKPKRTVDSRTRQTNGDNISFRFVLALRRAKAWVSIAGFNPSHSRKLSLCDFAGDKKPHTLRPIFGAGTKASRRTRTSSMTVSRRWMSKRCNTAASDTKGSTHVRLQMSEHAYIVK
jgi:hypothetical protein